MADDTVDTAKGSSNITVGPRQPTVLSDLPLATGPTLETAQKPQSKSILKTVLSRAASGLSAMGQGLENMGRIRTMKRGGKVRKAGLYKLHKNERILTAKQARDYKNKKDSRKSSRS